MNSTLGEVLKRLNSEVKGVLTQVYEQCVNVKTSTLVQERHDVFLDGLHDFVVAWAVGAGHFPHGGARFEEFALFSFDVVP